MPNRMEGFDGDEIEIQEERSGGGRRSRSGEKRRGRASKASKLKRRKLKPVAEDEEEEEEEEGGRPFKSAFLDVEAIEDDDDDEEEDEDDGEFDDFIVTEPEPEFGDERDRIDGGGGGRRRTGFVLPVEEEEDIEEFERRIEDRFRHVRVEEYEDDTEVGQQALIPGVKDPKLWLVKCLIGKEREVAGCLMQKFIDSPGELQIMSAIALDHLKGFVYVEAYKEAHVREACKGLPAVILQKICLVPIKEMTDVVSGESKSVVNYEWVRIKTGIYKGDIAKVVGHVPGRQQVRVKVIPRIDLHALAKGVESSKKGSGIRPDRVPALLGNMDLVKQLGVRVHSVRDPSACGNYIDKIDGLPGMIFEDGFHLKVVYGKSIKETKPSLQELEEFGELGGDGDHTNPNRKNGEGFMKGDAVVVTEGDLKNLVGRVDKFQLGIVHIRPEMEGLPDTVAVKQTVVQKCFREGQHVKVVSGSQQGATGMVVKVDQHKQLITILSDATKNAICVFSYHVVGSHEVNNGDTTGDSHLARYHKTPARFLKFSGCRRDGQDGFGKGVRVKLRLGPYKGCRGRVVEVKESNVRVELESQMRTVVVDRLHCISDPDNVAAAVTTPYRSGCETPMPYMRTPMRDPGATPMPYLMTPMRDSAASPMPYMMTPMRDLAATPYRMTPRRDPRATPLHGSVRTPPMTPIRDPPATPIHGGMRTPPIY